MKLGSVLLLLAAVAPSLAAQSSAPGRLEGLVRGPNAAGVSVELTRVRPEPVLALAARADPAGRFRFDSLVPGDYALHVSTPALDSLELSLPDRPIAIEAGKRARVELALPSGATVRDALCPGLVLGKGRGVVTGRAIDAASEQPLAGATVVVAWNELQVERATLKATSEEQMASAEADARGEYRLCGVPTGASLSLQLQVGSASGAIVKVVVADEKGVLQRDLSLVVDTVAAAEQRDPSSTRVDSTPPRPGAVGLRAPTAAPASLAGVVRGAAGQPLANAELRIDGTEQRAVSDEQGRYSLAGLPAGTRMLVVRRLGYEVTSVPVELRSGRSVQRDIRLTRVVSLDSIRVVAMRARFPDFEYNRRANPFGYYLTPDEIERRKGAFVSDMLYGVPGLMIVGHGRTASAISVHGRGGAARCAGMRIVVDGMQEGMELNDTPASQVAAIEIYAQGAFAPTQYSVRGSCGVLVIWTKKAARTPTPPKPAAAAP